MRERLTDLSRFEPPAQPENSSQYCWSDLLTVLTLFLAFGLVGNIDYQVALEHELAAKESARQQCVQLLAGMNEGEMSYEDESVDYLKRIVP